MQNSSLGTSPGAKRKTGVFRFVKSAVHLGDCPLPSLPEVGIVGRSNAGKSSLINAIVNQRLAKVSGVPGKTTLLNFFEGSHGYRLVDMPGYGYATRSHGERGSWRKMVEGYLREREVLRGVVLVMDCRRDWQEEERLLRDWLNLYGRPVVVAANKVDKLSRSDAARRVSAIRQQSGVREVFAVSAETKTGIVELENYIFGSWVQRREENLVPEFNDLGLQSHPSVVTDI